MVLGYYYGRFSATNYLVLADFSDGLVLLHSNDRMLQFQNQSKTNWNVINFFFSAAKSVIFVNFFINICVWIWSSFHGFQHNLYLNGVFQLVHFPHYCKVSLEPSNHFHFNQFSSLNISFALNLSKCYYFSFAVAFFVNKLFVCLFFFSHLFW